MPASQSSSRNLQNSVHGGENILVDGDKHARVSPSYGGKQGRELKEHAPAHPIFMSPILRYADDFCLTFNSPNNPQAMLHHLKACACRKFVAVNIKISAVVCFNSRLRIHHLLSMMIPGMMFDVNTPALCCRGSSQPLLGRHGSFCAFAHQHQIAHHLNAYFWLLKTHVIPGGRFRFRFTQGHLQPDCSAERPVTGPRQPT
eukprot:1158523-Pelagomonas_calceolata.AAC.1